MEIPAKPWSPPKPSTGSDVPVPAPVANSVAAPRAAIPVANFAAPQQQTFVQTSSAEKFRFCSRPGCKRNAYDCHGFTAAKCTNTECESMSEEQIRKVELEKKAEKKRRKSEVEQQRQKKKKRAEKQTVALT